MTTSIGNIAMARGEKNVLRAAIAVIAQTHGQSIGRPYLEEAGQGNVSEIKFLHGDVHTCRIKVGTHSMTYIVDFGEKTIRMFDPDLLQAGSGCHRCAAHSAAP